QEDAAAKGALTLQGSRRESLQGKGRGMHLGRAEEGEAKTLLPAQTGKQENLGPYTLRAAIGAVPTPTTPRDRPTGWPPINGACCPGRRRGRRRNDSWRMRGLLQGLPRQVPLAPTGQGAPFHLGRRLRPG